MLDRSQLPQSLGSNPSTYVAVANLLDGPGYTAGQLLERLGRITPSPMPPGPIPNADELVRDLQLLRILMPSGAGRWRRRPYFDGVEGRLALRYCVLALLLPAGEGRWRLPLLQLPDGVEHAVRPEGWAGGPALLQWYRQADLVRATADGRFYLDERALAPVDSRHALGEVLNRFLLLVRAARAAGPAAEDGRLPVLTAERLNAVIAEIQRELLIDDLTLRRIYRALIAGQHIILSGPPGTGKTQLARRLPELFWRAEARRLPSENPDDAPDTVQLSLDGQQAGYAVELVTATEEWSARDLIGGIAPLLTQHEGGNRLVYQIQHGHLTRTVLRHAPTYDGQRVPILRQRGPLLIDGRRYRGIWLVIDELNRAPVDTVFGSLLTTLSDRGQPFRVPTEYGETEVALPEDFRIIGTLNSFDRHFVNQLSEALKRRFTFIDIDPPARASAEREARLVLRQILQRLPQLGLSADGVVSLADDDQPTWQSSAAEQAYGSLVQLFALLRIYRKLGTAQLAAAALALFSGVTAGLDWPTALDAALADTVADQLQVLQRDEIQAIGLYLQTAGERERFTAGLNTLLEQLPETRYHAQIERLSAAHRDGPAVAAALRRDPLEAEWLAAVVELEQPALPAGDGLFARRLLSYLTDSGV